MNSLAINVPSVNPAQLAELAAKSIANRKPLLVTGMPGCGKSNILEDAVKTANGKLLLSHPAVDDPTDFKGLPWPQQGATRATFLPFGILADALEATDTTVWFLDDLGQASPAVQAACMQLLLARRVNGHVLPDCVTFIAATNRRVDRAGVTGILEPVKSRFGTIVELQPDIDSWCKWAYGAGISSTLIAFLRFKPDLLAKFEATADLTNSPVPRTWANLADIETWGLSTPVESEAFAGAVGRGAAIEYIAFRSMVRQLINLDAILLNPDKVAIPTKPGELYAVAVGLANRANDTNFARIATYATRLATEANRGEFAVLMIRDALRRDDKIAYTDAFVRLQSGPIGQLISGKEN